MSRTQEAEKSMVGVDLVLHRDIFEVRPNVFLLTTSGARKLLEKVDPAGNKYLAVLAENQETPIEPESFYGVGNVKGAYSLAQKKMLKAGFRRIELEE